MKKLYFKAFYISAISLLFCSCSGNNDAGQQQVTVPIAQEQPVQAAPTDTMAQTQQAAVTQTALPEAITAFIQQHFPNATVVGVEPDNEHGGLEYDVYLSDGTQVDFDANQQWDKVESMRGVPAFFIPKAIASYVKSNYQNLVITKIDKEPHGYEIELSNGLDLNFDNSGRFLGMDD